MKKEETEKKGMKISRRDFLSLTAAAGAIGAVGGVTPFLTSCESKPKYTPLKQAGEYYLPDIPDKAMDGKALKAGLIGCGGRGSGAIQNFLAAANDVTITALGDVFPDRVESVQKQLGKAGIEIPNDKCFTGFDAYKSVIDSGVDVVIICTPPVFRPVHFKYATEKGVHSFLEKPIAVDSEGYRSIMATAKQAAAKNLSVVTGTQRHHQRSYLASYQKIMEGYIGEITGGNVYWNQGMLWYRERQDNWSDMEWMIRDWVNWKWLSGDHIVEQHVHNIDVFTWFSGLKPVSATAFGSRQRRITGDQYDNFSVDFVFEGGIHMHSMCRQIDGCSNNVSEFIQGTKGMWYGGGDDPYITDLDGNVIWKFDKDAVHTAHAQNDPYTLEHVDWINHIRSNQPINEAEATALSCLAGIMGRESAYTGQTVTWDQISAANQGYLPEDPQLGKVDMSKYTVQVPGTGK
jgi:predicted dehydrogenase